MSLLGKQDLDILVDEVKQDINRKVNAIKGDLFAPSENTKYTTVKGVKEFTCEESGYVDNVYLEGETLINVGEIKQKDWNTTSEDCIRCRFYQGANQNYYPIHDGVYTFYNYTNKKITFPFLSTSSTTTWGTGLDVPANSCVVATVPNDYTCVGADFCVRNGWQQSDMDSIDTKLVMVLPGTHPYMPYFKGISSVGQGDKIEVLTRCKNLLTSTIEYGTINTNTGINADVRYDRYRTSDFIRIEKNKTYAISTNVNVFFYGIDKTFVKMIASTNSFVGSDNGYIKVNGACSLNQDLGTINLQIEEGNVSTDYETPKYDKKQILCTLRSLPNGVRDKVYKIGDKYYKYEKCIEIPITDEHIAKMTLESAQDNATTMKPLISRFLEPYGVVADGNITNIYCNNFNGFMIYDSTVNVEGVYYSKTYTMHFRMLKTKLATQDLPGVKKWFTDNPTTIVVELAQPRLIELPNFNPRTFTDKTTFLCNSGVVPIEVGFEVTNNLRSEVDVLKDKVDSAFQSGSSTKKNLADKLTSVGVPNMSVSNTFAELIASIPMKGTDVKIATGEIMSLSKTLQYSYLNGSGKTTIAYTPLQLDFDPDILMYLPINTGTCWGIMHNLDWKFSSVANRCFIVNGAITSDYSSSTQTKTLKCDESVVCGNNLFNIPFVYQNNNAIYIAIKYK